MTRPVDALLLAVALAALMLPAPALARTQCLASPGNIMGTWWAWRMIDGKQCWYAGRPGMDKSLLYWGTDDGAPADVDRAPESARPVAPALAPLPTDVVTPPPAPAPTPVEPLEPGPKRTIITVEELWPATDSATDDAKPLAFAPADPAPATVVKPVGLREWAITSLVITGISLLCLSALARRSNHNRWR